MVFLKNNQYYKIIEYLTSKTMKYEKKELIFPIGHIRFLNTDFK